MGAEQLEAVGAAAEVDGFTDVTIVVGLAEVAVLNVVGFTVEVAGPTGVAVGLRDVVVETGRAVLDFSVEAGAEDGEEEPLPVQPTRLPAMAMSSYQKVLAAEPYDSQPK
jgi:hypothetical protein